MVLINSGFHTRTNLSESIPQFGHAPSELFASPILCRKSLKNIGLKGRRIIKSARGANMSWAGLVVRRRLVFVYRRFGTVKGELLDP